MLQQPSSAIATLSAAIGGPPALTWRLRCHPFLVALPAAPLDKAHTFNAKFVPFRDVQNKKLSGEVYSLGGQRQKGWAGQPACMHAQAWCTGVQLVHALESVPDACTPCACSLRR